MSEKVCSGLGGDRCPKPTTVSVHFKATGETALYCSFHRDHITWWAEGLAPADRPVMVAL